MLFVYFEMVLCFIVDVVCKYEIDLELCIKLYLLWVNFVFDDGMYVEKFEVLKLFVVDMNLQICQCIVLLFVKDSGVDNELCVVVQ